jgi:hypothetical protein
MTITTARSATVDQSGTAAPSPRETIPLLRSAQGADLLRQFHFLASPILIGRVINAILFPADT